MSRARVTSNVPVISVEEVLSLLKKGYTRYEKDNKGFGSIQAKYGLNAHSVTKLFRTTTGLKFRKTVAPSFIIENEVVEDNSVSSDDLKDEIMKEDNESMYS